MKRFAVLLGSLLTIGIFAAPAYAHQNSIFGEVSCDTGTGQQVVTWFNVGDAARFGPAVITASDRAAVMTGQSIPAETTVQVGTETFANDATGTVTLTESWFWAADQFTNHNSGSVELGIDCASPSPTTPPPTTPPPTTVPPTSPPPSTSTPPTTTEPPDPTPTCIPRPPHNHSPNPHFCTAYTGSDAGTLLWYVGGFAALGAVALLLARKRVIE
jgi:hypothetical protein